ncbi:MAG: 30S ribosomal protein S4e [Candidatus Bathyarchaeota archaeon]
MGRKGERGHLKRKPAPKLWPIHRKEAVWTVMSKPGPHSRSGSLPLTLIVRDMLGLAKTGKEAKNIISQGTIMVDGKVRRDEHFLVGLMDVVSIVDAKKFYRVLPSKKGLMLHPIKSDEAAVKLYRIEDKTIVKGGQLQLDFHDGTCSLINEGNAQAPQGDVYQTLDVLQFSVPEQEILGHTKLVKGANAIVIGGKNMGKVGKVTAIEKKPNQKRRDTIVTIEDADGIEFQTILDLVFILGDKTSSISIPEVA